MPMPPYAVLCYRAGCGAPVGFKIAARWSDGVTRELKCYALSCEACLPELYRVGGAKRAACRLAPGETLEAVGIYEWTPDRRDRDLRRLLERETEASG